MAEADGHLQQRIKQLLKLSKEKWDAACEHAKTAVQVCIPSASSVMFCLWARQTTPSWIWLGQCLRALNERWAGIEAGVCSS